MLYNKCQFCNQKLKYWSFSNVFYCYYPECRSVKNVLYINNSTIEKQQICFIINEEEISVENTFQGAVINNYKLNIKYRSLDCYIDSEDRVKLYLLLS